MMKNRKFYDVLLIEPDIQLAKTYISALKSTGIKVGHAQSAQSAIILINQYKPKLIILELQLKKHNGIEFLNELGSYVDLQDIPVVLLTFIPESSIKLIREQKARLNIVDYLYKPRTSLEQLINMTREILAT